MPNQFAGTLDSYLWQAKSLLSQADQLRIGARNSRSNPARDIAAEVGGGIGEYLLESSVGRKLGRKIARRLAVESEKQSMSQAEHALEASFSNLLDNIRNFLSSVSITRTNLKPPGNSELLLQRLRRIDEASRLETKIRRTITVLEGLRHESLIYNSEISSWLEQLRTKAAKESKPYEIMQELESNLRSFIVSKLESVSSNWWKERIPSDVQQRAEERKAKDERLYPWQKPNETQLIHFVDFADYVKIIIRKDNWDAVFSKVFKEKEMISAKLRELEPIRNAIAHFRGLEQRQADKLRVYASDLSALLGHR